MLFSRRRKMRLTHCKQCKQPMTDSYTYCSDACVKAAVNAVYVKPDKRKRPKAELESVIKARIRKAMIDAGCICWIHDVDNRQMKTGLGKGTSDIIAIVPPSGRFLGVEVKRPGYHPSDVRPEQTRWLAVVRQFGGVSGIATSESEALALVAEARQHVIDLQHTINP